MSTFKLYLSVIVMMLIAAVAGCGGGSPPDGDSSPVSGVPTQAGGADGGGGSSALQGTGAPKVTALSFIPPTASVSLSDSQKTATASFVLSVTYDDGHVQAVVPEAAQFDRPDLGTVALGNPVVLTASSPYAGEGKLHAVYGGMNATATFTVQQTVSVVGADVPAAAVSSLNGGGLPPDPSVQSLLYPYDKTVFGLGLPSPLIMWNAPASGDVYRLHLEQKNFVYDGYFSVKAPASLSAAQPDWDRITVSNGGDPLKVSLSRWDASKKTAYASAAQSWTIAPASLQGTIYYATAVTWKMWRMRVGAGATPELLFGGRCLGCHAVSADGTTMGTAASGAGTVEGYKLPSLSATPTINATASSGALYYPALTRDGKYLVAGGVQRLSMFDTSTAAQVNGSGLESFALDPGYSIVVEPAFSPDGKRFAAAEGNMLGNGVAFTRGKLVLWDWDEVGLKFTNPTKLADGATFPAGKQAVAFPTFAPDSQNIVFNVSDSDRVSTGSGSALWMQSVSGSAPVRLSATTDSPPNPADRDLAWEPTFNPQTRGGYNWVVFTSKRTWGNRPNPGGLWIAAVDASPNGNADPSHPAFYLQGQDDTAASSGNPFGQIGHEFNVRGFWALQACVPSGTACTQPYDCCSGFCQAGSGDAGGTCIDVGKVSCGSVGDACASDGACCGAGAVQCIDGKCAIPPTR